jgi:hypothetical protein
MAIDVLQYDVIQSAGHYPFLGIFVPSPFQPGKLLYKRGLTNSENVTAVMSLFVPNLLACL